MNFVTIKFELNDRSIAMIMIDEGKIQHVLEKLNSVTNAWISED